MATAVGSEAQVTADGKRWAVATAVGSEVQVTVDGRTLSGHVTANGGFVSDDGRIYLDPSGAVQHGITAPDGSFIPNGTTHAMPDGSTLYGIRVGDSFYSSDGSTVVLGNGTVVHGHLDSGSGIFTADNGAKYGVTKAGIFSGTAQGNGSVELSNGQTLSPEVQRVVDGQTVSGHLTSGGGFLSNDGTVFVDANGVVERGRTTSAGMFETSRVVDGQTQWGSSTTGGGWLSEDGKTFIDSTGKVEHGIKAPDGTFIPNGTTRTLPDGTTVYGTTVGDSFYSYNGSILILGDGTVVNGQLDSKTGVFTSGNGTTYAVTKSGIHSGVLQSDGSLLLSDGTTFMTPGAWKVDLAAMLDTISVVTKKSGSISGYIDTITREYSNIEAAWSSPAGQSFADVTKKANVAMAALQNMLADMIRRMQITHDNYEATEKANTQNNANYG